MSVPPSCLTDGFYFRNDVAFMAAALALWLTAAALSFARDCCRARRLALWRIIRLSTLAALYLHPPVSATALGLLSCQPVQLSQFAVTVLKSGSPSAALGARAPNDGALTTVSLLSSNPYIVCFSPVHLPAGVFACITLAFYVVGLPAYSLVLTWRDPWLRARVGRRKPASRRRSSVGVLPPPIAPESRCSDDPVDTGDALFGAPIVKSGPPDDDEAQPVVWPFLRDSGYELHSWFFRHVDVAVVLGLTSLSALLPLPATLSLLAVKLALTLAVLGSLLVCLALLRNPYVEPWKWYLRVSLVTLSMSCVVVNGASRAADLGYDSAALSAFIAPASYLNMSVLVITVAVALGGFLVKERSHVRQAREGATLQLLQPVDVRAHATEATILDFGASRSCAVSLNVAAVVSTDTARGDVSAERPTGAESRVPVGRSGRSLAGLEVMPTRELHLAPNVASRAIEPTPPLTEMRQASGSRLLRTWNRLTSAYRGAAPQGTAYGVAARHVTAVQAVSEDADDHPVPGVPRRRQSEAVSSAASQPVSGLLRPAPARLGVMGKSASPPRRSVLRPSGVSTDPQRARPSPSRREEAQGRGTTIGGVDDEDADPPAHFVATPASHGGGGQAADSSTSAARGGIDSRDVLRRSGLNLLADASASPLSPPGGPRRRGVDEHPRSRHPALLRRPSTASGVPTAPSLAPVAPAEPLNSAEEPTAFRLQPRRASAADLAALSAARRDGGGAPPPRRRSWYGAPPSIGPSRDAVPGDSLLQVPGAVSPSVPRSSLLEGARAKPLWMQPAMHCRSSSPPRPAGESSGQPRARRMSAAMAAAGAAAVVSKPPLAAAGAWGQ